MKATEITRRYHDAWSGRDANALVACFIKDGTFCNPDTYPELPGRILPILSRECGRPFQTFLLNCSMLVKLSLVWSLTTG
jgi:ketosteroid isomerase-like protein